MKIESIEYAYTVEKQEDGKFLVQFVDFEEAFTEGNSEDEAAFHAVEVLSLTIEQRLADGVEIPAPSAHLRGMKKVLPQASVQAALLLRQVRQQQHMALADLARAMQTSWPAAQRLEQPGSNTTLKQLERAAAVLGKKLVVGLA